MVLHAAGTVKDHLAPEVWERGIVVSSAAQANAWPVAQYTLATVLLAGKRAFRYAAPGVAGATGFSNLDPALGNHARTVGVVGASRIGRLVVPLLAAHGYRVQVSDPTLTAAAAAALLPADLAQPVGRPAVGVSPVQLVDLETLLVSSDIVTLHAPLLPETRHLIDARRLDLLRDGAVLVNTARGALVDTDALTRHCTTGRIDAVLDVTDPEPLPTTHPLRHLPNVWITPTSPEPPEPRSVHSANSPFTNSNASPPAFRCSDRSPPSTSLTSPDPHATAGPPRPAHPPPGLSPHADPHPHPERGPLVNATSPEAATPRMPRRALLRATGMLGLAVSSAGALSACATASSSGSGAAPAAGATSASNPLGVSAGAPLEVFVFKGGYGDAYAVYDESLYNKAFPKAKISHNGVQQMQTQLQPRFVGGNPPDLIDNSGASVFPLPTLVANGQVTDLTPLLNAPSFDDPGKTVGQTLQAGALDAVTYDGKVMGLPYVSTAKGFWYSKSLFDKHGWTWPTTWEGLTALLGEMKQAGIAPIAYGGSDSANYFLYPLFSLAGKQGGVQTLIDIDNLKAGAWQSEPMQNAAAAIAQLAATGMFLAGSTGLNHTQAQTSWVQGKAGIYSSGSWIESEMTGITPADFQMTFGNVPLLSSGDKLPVTAVLASALETYIVPAQARNPRGAMELLRIMLSRQGAAHFSELTHAPTVVTGATGTQSFGSTAYASVEKALAVSGQNTFTYLFSSWYPTIGKEANTQIANLLAGRVDGPGFLKAMQAAADKVASDSSIPKHHR